MSGIFKKIIDGEIPSYKVAEDDRYYAFLDINPLAMGHTLAVPKVEVDYLFDLDIETYTGLFAFVKKVSVALKSSTGCKRVGLMVYGLDVPHAHIHLVPLKGIGNELNFSNPKINLTPEEFKTTADSIYKEFLKL